MIKKFVLFCLGLAAAGALLKVIFLKEMSWAAVTAPAWITGGAFILMCIYIFILTLVSEFKKRFKN